MASNPPFQVEDQTDEDFFDKLVDDDDDDVNVKVGGAPTMSSVASSGHVFTDEDESDEVRAFSSLSLNEGDDGELHDMKVPSEANGEVKEVVDNSGAAGGGGFVGVVDHGAVQPECNGVLESSNSFDFGALDSENSVAFASSGEGNKVPALESVNSFDFANGGGESKENTGSEASNSTLSESGAARIKELQWSAFSATREQPNDNTGFGSYSDFFTELDQNASEVSGDLANSFGYGATPAVSAGLSGNAVNSFGYDPATTAVSAGVSGNVVNSFGYDPATTAVSAGVSGNAVNSFGYDPSTTALSAGISGNAVNSFGYDPAATAVSAGVSGNAVNNFGYEATTSVSANEVQDAQASSYDNYQQGYTYGTDAQQITDPSSIEYYESLYPGWKIDRTTGEWYQVDGYNAGESVQGVTDSNLSGDWVASDGQANVSYLQNSVQSASGTMAASGTTGSVTNWDQASHVGDASGGESNWNHASQVSDPGDSTNVWNQASVNNSEYPPHMVFDPQYPDYIYDSNAQQWLEMEAYRASLQPAAEVQNQVRQDDAISVDAFSDSGRMSDMHGHVENNYSSHGLGAEAQNYSTSASFKHYTQQSSTMWQPEAAVNTRSSSDYRPSQQMENHYGQNFDGSNHNQQQFSSDYRGPVSHFEKASQDQNQFSTISGSQTFVNPGTFTHQSNQPTFHNPVEFSQHQFHSAQQFSHAPQPARSSAGRPPCALVSFGFGGKIIVAKGCNLSEASSFESQNTIGTSISVLNFMEVVAKNVDTSDYLRDLCRQSFPGPLSGGSASLNKWIDEKISNSGSPNVDYRREDVLRLLLSLLKISVLYQGKLRSPLGADTLMKENEAEGAIAKLFAASKSSGAQYNDYGSIAHSHCLLNLPSEGLLRATASEVQSLLVSGRKKEALQHAQDGQLWGPALVLAAQLGDQFYVDTVKQMALKHLVAGSPLRTLCLLIAGQPADVFNTDATAVNSMPGGVNMNQQSTQGMLDDWKENLAVITANRTKDDHLVLIHLGDCLWKENSDVVAAHTCYLVAESNFEPYSDTARLCLLGADHWKFPRTYASPEAIQRTEIYEYSKVLGNPQFILLPFQPYKLVYAHMLVEVGRVSDALKYCQAVQKALKNGRSPEVETLRQVASSLEERIKNHQQGGFSTNLAAGKLLGKVLNLFDTTAHRVVGGLPPIPSTSGSHMQSGENYQAAPRVLASQSTMAMSSLVPSAADGGNRRAIHNRSISEPDFGRTPRQVDASKEASSPSTQGESSEGGSSRRRFSFGSQFFQKTVGLVLKPRLGRQAKLGDENKFYFDKTLNTWVEKGSELPAKEAALPPPPPTAAFPNGMSDYNLKTALKNEGSQIGNGGSPEYKTPSMDQGPGIPPLPPTSNQFSSRSRVGVRSRYVDTFNKGGVGGGSQPNMFQSPSASSIKPSINASSNAKFFIPAPVSSNTEEMIDNNTGGAQNTNYSEKPSVSGADNSFHSPPQPPSASMQRFGSMGNVRSAPPNGSFASNSRRTASWSEGSFQETSFSPESANNRVRPLGEVLRMPMSAPHSPGSGSLMHPPLPDELHEVEL